ncbi:MAG: laccase domain-containing protein, partial [Sutterellaceae bacterium]|nr:laccase domain-containing protein [Sutterellaceae bacterium]
MNLEPLLPAPRTIAPGWNAPDSVHALFTLREGGVSKGPWGGAGGDRGFNVGSRCGDDPAAVKRNRESLILVAGTAPRWLHQVHGTRIVRAEDAAEEEEADGSWTTAKGVVLAIQTADCLPVVITDEEGSVLVALHAGWRGLSAGILQEGVRTALLHRASPEAGLIAWLAPRIGTESFEVGEDVLRAMESKIPDA